VKGNIQRYAVVTFSSTRQGVHLARQIFVPDVTRLLAIQVFLNGNAGLDQGLIHRNTFV
jgi:hypothetical protein